MLGDYLPPTENPQHFLNARRFPDLSPMKPLLPLLSLLVVLACSVQPPQPLLPAFFCWETVLKIPAADRALLDSLGVAKVYIKVLDIGRNPINSEIEPYSITDLSDRSGLLGLNVVPTIFITNEVFKNISEQQIEWLASKVAAPPFSLPIGGGRGAALLDCDWTPSTRDAFFLFLKKLRERLPPGTRLTATIRLHQYKFPQQTGVPPVDRGMLMFYNTGDVDKEGERNTVFHPDDALKYVVGAPKHYPLPLDLALPLFSWGIVYREGELWKIIPGPLPLEEMRRSGKYAEIRSNDPFAAKLWELREGTFLGGHYLRPGDRLRVSATTPELLFKSAEIAQQLDLAKDATLAFFHLGIARSEHFSAQLLDSVCKTVRQ